jgi:hypothetical protein
MEFLLDKNNHYDHDEGSQPADLESYDPDSGEILADNVVGPRNDLHVSHPLSPLSKPGPATPDTLSQGEILQPPADQLSESDPHVRERKILRYGRAYFGLYDTALRSILKKSRSECSLPETLLPLQSPSVASEINPVLACQVILSYLCTPLTFLGTA